MSAHQIATWVEPSSHHQELLKTEETEAFSAAVQHVFVFVLLRFLAPPLRVALALSFALLLLSSFLQVSEVSERCA